MWSLEQLDLSSTTIQHYCSAWPPWLALSASLQKNSLTVNALQSAPWRCEGRQKRWEDNIREWTGLEFGKSQRAVENREKWRKLVAKSSVVPKRPSRLRDWWWWWWWWVYFTRGKGRQASIVTAVWSMSLWYEDHKYISAISMWYLSTGIVKRESPPSKYMQKKRKAVCPWSCQHLYQPKAHN